jgi:hypothetical protein
VAKRRDPIPGASPQDDRSISEVLMDEVSSLQFPLLSARSVDDAVPGKLGFWKVLMEYGLSDSIVEKLRDFMCSEIESLGWTGMLLFEINGYDEKDGGQWMIQLHCEPWCPNIRTIRLSATVDLRKYWGFVHILTVDNSMRMLIYE